MRMIELGAAPPSVTSLLDAVQTEDVVLVRDGRPLARLEKFEQDDLEDWEYEHSREAIAIGEAARKEYREGKARPLTEDKEEEHLQKASGEVRSLYFRYRAAIVGFGDRGARITWHGNKKKTRVTFEVNTRRFTSVTIQKGNLKFWLKVRPGSLADPKKLTRRTQVGHTISVRDDTNFDAVVGLIRQAYSRNKSGRNGRAR